MDRVILKKKREEPLVKRHPWVFSGAVDKVEGEPGMGATVEVYSSTGEWLARAAYSPHSSIRARVWTWKKDEQIGAGFFRNRIQEAAALRSGLPSLNDTDSYRLVHGESDGLPGLVVDRYGDYLVVQFLAASAERWREEIVEALLEVTSLSNVYERSDVDVRRLEGLQERVGLLAGSVPETPVRIHENGLNFLVDLRAGQKTGFYLDQRTNRALVRQMADGKEVLNCFCYTGGFSLHALAGGARRVLSIDSSAEALALAEENLRLNGLDVTKVEWMQGDVFVELRGLRDRRASFDLIILDPPKFAPTAAQAEKAARGYKDINLLALKLLRPGGLLFTFSCSGGVSAEFFRKIVAGAALDAGVDARVIQQMRQDGDHPVSVHFPEGEYLKGLALSLR